ncbi:MAG TPA: hypothetical protein VFF95_19310 [Candidatus Binatus sp.]|nr:hypothetical protein [Candidatus Binatus sp.]
MNSATTIEKSPERPKRSETTPDHGSQEKVRRTRGVTPVKRSKTPKMKSNGNDTSTSTSTSKVNGHGLVSPSHTAQDMDAPLEMGRAASDDARDIPSAAAASSAAAGTERGACAEVAPPPEGGTNGSPKPKKDRDKGARETSHVPSDKDKNKDTNENVNSHTDTETQVDIPPGAEPLPADGAGFVDAMHKHVDLYKACARLVRSTDEKIAQRMSERLLEMKYGKGPSAAAEETPEIVIDIDSAVAKRAAEGANR